MNLDDYYDLYEVNTDIPEPDDLHFVAPKQLAWKPLEDLFLSVEFQDQNTPADAPLKLTQEDNVWVSAKVRDPDLKTPAPSVAAERAAERVLKNSVSQPYDFIMPVSQDQWQNFVLYKYYQLANDPDPKIAKGALDSLAKTNVVNLSAERTEVNINMKSTVELESELASLMSRLVWDKTKVIQGEAERV